MCPQEDEGGPLTYDEVRDLKYLEQVMSESLRLYPPVVTFISREAAHDFKASGPGHSLGLLYCFEILAVLVMTSALDSFLFSLSLSRIQ